MSKAVEHRSVTPLVKTLREICRGRPIRESLRHADGLAARTQPMPNVPLGPYHKTSKVYYYTRDARRLVQPPIELFSQAQIGSGQIKLNVPCKTEEK
ncbi:NADH dehydrogenase [ubiquinone] 1 alpha subcomplex subunit 7 isoform X2 [Xylocopa sonorina]|uniref:NADH dehydrogenase [ubiquinone] 1 alpha subcomplex subunit 7 isoform X2 n=1 Tax=Xylocopa sonorina TaxID=1818115 RepID=UPI00403B0FB3